MCNSENPRHEIQNIPGHTHQNNIRLVLDSMKEQLMNLISGRLRFQKLFEKLYMASLRGMNIGTGSDCETSGEMSVIKKLINSSPKWEPQVVFDVGANIGKYTLMLDKFFPENTTIYSFEPSKYAFKKLKNNLNKVNRVNLNNFGFSSHGGKPYCSAIRKEVA